MKKRHINGSEDDSQQKKGHMQMSGDKRFRVTLLGGNESILAWLEYTADRRWSRNITGISATTRSFRASEAY